MKIALFIIIETLIIFILLAIIYYSCFLQKFPFYDKLFKEIFEKVENNNKLINEVKEWKDDLEEISNNFNNQ